jgi:flagellar M-ring protein FliF
MNGLGLGREAQLRAEVERLLAARVGEGKAIVTVAVDTASESETIVERIIDPSSRIAISTDTREVTDNSVGGVGGAATAASNLPQAGQPAQQQPTRNRAETEERVNFEISQTTRERVRPAGDVRRLTVAVLVDGVSRFDAAGNRTWEPRSQAELDQIRQLVQAAVGFDAERGDVVTVEMLEFAERPTVGVEAVSTMAQFMERNAMNLIQMAFLGAVALGLALFVLRPLMRAAEAQALPEPAAAPLLDYADTARSEPEPEQEPDRIEMLKDTFAERRDDSASVLRSWLERDVIEASENESEAR